MRHWAVIQSRIVLFVLTRCVTRTRLTQREFVIATGHHFRSRTTAPKCLILRPAREKRSQTVSNGEPLFCSVELRPAALNTAPHRTRLLALAVSALNSARLRRPGVGNLHSLLVRTRSGGPEDTPPEDTPQCPAVAPEDTDLELSRGENGREWLTQPLRRLPVSGVRA